MERRKNSIAVYGNVINVRRQIVGKCFTHLSIMINSITGHLGTETKIMFVQFLHTAINLRNVFALPLGNSIKGRNQEHRKVSAIGHHRVSHISIHLAAINFLGIVALIIPHLI